MLQRDQVRFVVHVGTLKTQWKENSYSGRVISFFQGAHEGVRWLCPMHFGFLGFQIHNNPLDLSLQLNCGCHVSPNALEIIDLLAV